MIIDCISDLHGFYPELEGGDLLIIAGDLTRSDKSNEYIEFYKWLEKQKYKKKIVVPGNHDNYFQKCNEFSSAPFSDELADYLCDSGIEFEGLKIWGSPWTKTFPGMNPKCKAFTCDTEEELDQKWALIPDDTDILITHSPSWGINDTNIDGERCGSTTLTNWIARHVTSLQLFVCGHIHEAYGIYNVRRLQDRLDEMYTPIHVNASHVDEYYRPINDPIRVEFRI